MMMNAKRELTTTNFDLVATALRRRSTLGVMRALFTAAEQAYVLSCTARVGTTSIAFTRDRGMVVGGMVRDAAHDRCWHLSLVCADRRERDAWLSAFFGARTGEVWAEELHGIDHYRLFCDDKWRPITVTNVSDLRRAHLVPLDEFNITAMPRAFVG
jgi:hypothetical protein